MGDFEERTGDCKWGQREDKGVLKQGRTHPVRWEIE